MSHAVWRFQTARFEVQLRIERDHNYCYDGVAFDSEVRVLLDGDEIASDHLGSSVYAASKESDFWTAHRDSNPMNRNCSIFRAVHPNTSICHYFPDMVRSAIKDARVAIGRRPYIRAA